VLNRAKFSSQALKILCDEVYGKLTLAQCPSFVLLPSLLLDNHAPDALQRACENRYYHNLPKRKDDRERRRRAVSFNTLRQRQQREQERRKREREAASQQAAPPPSEARPPSPALAYKASSDSGRDEDHHHHHHHQQQQQQEGPPSSPFFEIGSSPVDTSRPRPPPAASFGGGPEHGEGEGDGEGDPRVNEMLSETASDLVMRTIAAPTYFPSHQQHVDGVPTPPTNPPHLLRFIAPPKPPPIHIHISIHIHPYPFAGEISNVSPRCPRVNPPSLSIPLLLVHCRACSHTIRRRQRSRSPSLPIGSTRSSTK
jgi:hypothetical protein